MAEKYVVNTRINAHGIPISELWVMDSERPRNGLGEKFAAYCSIVRGGWWVYEVSPIKRALCKCGSREAAESLVNALNGKIIDKSG